MCRGAALWFTGVMHRRILLAPVLAFALVVVLPTSALASKKSSKSGGGSAAVGHDVSYPQCGGALPPSPAFGIVGVNNGIVYSSHPRLASPYAWGVNATSATGPKVSFYANTANPGPSSSHWPTGATTPMACTSATLSASCAYDYGWNAAADAFKRAVAVAGTPKAQVAPWWLDVEAANSWTTDTVANRADIQGAADYLTTPVSGGGAGVTGGVGLYTNASSWQTITGSTSQFASYPSWVPGAGSVTAAQSNCSASITGGHVVYAQ